MMKTKRRPEILLLTILAVAICLTLFKLFGTVIFRQFDNTFIGYFAAQLFFAVLALGTAFILRQTDVLHTDWSKLKGGWTSAGLMIFMILFYFMLGWPKLVTSTAVWWEILFFLGYAFLIGFCEELLFRGLIQRAMHRYFGEDSGKAVVLAILFSALFFGASHLANLTQPGTSLRSVLYQVCGVTAAGVYSGAIYYRCGKNFWFVAVLHGLYDLCALIMDGTLNGNPITAASEVAAGSELAGILLWMVVYAVATAIVLRPKKLRPLLDDKA